MTTAALHVARTGLDAQNAKMRVIANNLANVNTTGFKRDRATFETLAYQQMVAAGAPSSAENRYATGFALGTGVQVNGTAKVDTIGAINQTGNALDMAIQGSGYFQVTMPDGKVAYTRDGSFKLSSEGQIVTTDGMPLVPNMAIPQGATGITIGGDGTVSATLQGENAPTELGRLEITRFMNPAGLEQTGNNLLLETAASGAPQTGIPGLEGRGVIMGGSLEGSNVNVVEELVDMIETQRAYEVNSKMIKATDEMLQYVNQQL